MMITPNFEATKNLATHAFTYWSDGNTEHAITPPLGLDWSDEAVVSVLDEYELPRPWVVQIGNKDYMACNVLLYAVSMGAAVMRIMQAIEVHLEKTYEHPLGTERCQKLKRGIMDGTYTVRIAPYNTEHISTIQ